LNAGLAHSWPRTAEGVAVAALGAAFSLPCVFTQAWSLQLLCIGLLAWRTSGVKPAHAALLGLSFGGGWLMASTWWLFISMHRYGGLSAPIAVLAVAGLALALSAYLAIALALFARLRCGNAWLDAGLFAALWLGAELARGTLLTGFPWAATGYGQIDGPLAALAPWVGVYGIGFVTAGIAALPGLALSRGARSALAPAMTAAALLAAATLAAHDFTAGTGKVGVSLVQTNVAQEEKFALDHLPQALDWLEGALADARGPLVLAPETAIPLLPDQLGPEAWGRLSGMFRGDRAALIGIPLGSFETGYTNSVAGLSAQSATLPGGFYRYDKQHLVPFGEFIPTGFRWFVDMMRIPLGDFARGPRVPASFAFGGQRIAPNICYEDLFGEELALRFADQALAPTLLANVSNIGWFGDTIAIAQHLHISRMRTLELQRPMLRATNTGATAVIDHRGHITAALAPFARATLDSAVEGRRGLTPFVRWASRLGLAPAWLLAALPVLLAVMARLRRRKEQARSNVLANEN
jgi:apolipoprotein N-acyltransferase